jgi:hypothetical protein
MGREFFRPRRSRTDRKDGREELISWTVYRVYWQVGTYPHTELNTAV